MTWTFYTLSSIKHPTAECWHLHAVPLLIVAFLLFENIVLLEEKHTHTHTKKKIDNYRLANVTPNIIFIQFFFQHVLKILIKHQVNINKSLSAGKNKMTPLMIASSHGYLDIARILVQNGASIEILGEFYPFSDSKTLAFSISEAYRH